MDDFGITIRQQPVATRAEVITRLRELETEFRALGATALRVYGSAARDALTPESDVDLYIDYQRDGSLDFFMLCRMEDLAVEVLRRDVDFGTLAGLHPYLRDSIMASSTRIF